MKKAVPIVIGLLVLGAIGGSVYYFAKRQPVNVAPKEGMTPEEARLEAQKNKMNETAKTLEETRRANERAANNPPPTANHDPNREIQNTLRTVEEINRINRMNQELQQRQNQQNNSNR